METETEMRTAAVEAEYIRHVRLVRDTRHIHRTPRIHRTRTTIRARASSSKLSLGNGDSGEIP